MSTIEKTEKIEVKKKEEQTGCGVILLWLAGAAIVAALVFGVFIPMVGRYADDQEIVRQQIFAEGMLKYQQAEAAVANTDAKASQEPEPASVSTTVTTTTVAPSPAPAPAPQPVPTPAVQPPPAPKKEQVFVGPLEPESVYVLEDYGDGRVLGFVGRVRFVLTAYESNVRKEFTQAEKQELEAKDRQRDKDKDPKTVVGKWLFKPVPGKATFHRYLVVEATNDLGVYRPGI